MFFQTQVKSLNGGVATDTSGRHLIFIGNLPCQVGDWVWTDGTVIFGNVPPRSTPLLTNEGGIPVLGDNLSGYFTRQGNFKEYKVKQDDWIVNSKYHFFHNTYSDENIIDAYVKDDGTQIIATGGIYRNSRVYNQSDYIDWPGDVVVRIWKPNPKYKDIWMGKTVVSEQILGSSNFPNQTLPTKLFVNGEEKLTIDLSIYANDVESRAMKCTQSIMQNSYKDSDTQHCFTPEMIALGYTGSLSRPLPDQPCIVYTVAQVLSCNGDKNALNGIVSVATYGYCFPYIPHRFKAAFLMPYNEKHLMEYDWYVQNLPENTYPIKDEKLCVPFGFSALYQIGNLTPLAFRSYGGVKSNLLIIDEAVLIDKWTGEGDFYYYPPISTIIDWRYTELLPNSMNKELDENFLLPVGEGFYRMDKFGRLTFYNSDKVKVAENIPVHKDYYHIEIDYGAYYPIFTAVYFNDKPYLFCKEYTSDGNVKRKAMIITDHFVNVERYPDEYGNRILEMIFAEQATSYFANKGLAPMDGYYIKQANGTLKPLQFTPLFYQFKNGAYLYGIREGKLYHKKSDGSVEIVGDGVKNFRLCELKNINKAKGANTGD